MHTITNAPVPARPDEDTQPQVRCRYLGVHRPHPYCNGQCPGQPCDHENLCCGEHDHHVMPHVGCMLR